MNGPLIIKRAVTQRRSVLLILGLCLTIFARFSATAEDTNASTLQPVLVKPVTKALSALSESILEQVQNPNAKELLYNDFIRAVEANHPKLINADLKRRIAGAGGK